MKLLIIEDDKQISDTIEEELGREYIVSTSSNGEDGEFQALSNNYDLIILDLSLPDKDGLSICRTLRKSAIDTPILILTGETNPKATVELLDSGADDYLTKPYKIEELKARIRVLLRRKKRAILSNILSLADLTLDLNKKSVTRRNLAVNLRRKEFYLLEYLVRNAGNVVSREMIMDYVWDTETDSLTNVVDVHVKYLRDRIDKPFDKKLIKTVHGIGYKIEA